MHLSKEMFKDRKQAGRLLLKRLEQTPFPQDTLVLALPRGGVPVAFEVAQGLRLPLDVLVVRKVGAPGNPEYGIGAITEDAYHRIDSQAAWETSTTSGELEQRLAAEAQEVARRVQKYRKDRPLPPLKEKTILLVDDGLATGRTARVACEYLFRKGAKAVILAVPVASPRSAEELRQGVATEVVTLEEPEDFMSVGQFYENFTQTEDQEVIDLLERSARAGDLRKGTSARRAA